MNLTELYNSIPEGGAVLFTRQKFIDDAMLRGRKKKIIAIFKEGDQYRLANQNQGYERRDVPTHVWDETDDFVVLEALPLAPVAGTVSEAQLRTNGWTAELIEANLGDPLDGGFTRSLWAKEDVNKAAAAPELKKTLAANRKAVRDVKKSAKAEAEAQAKAEAEAAQAAEAQRVANNKANREKHLELLLKHVPAEFNNNSDLKISITRDGSSVYFVSPYMSDALPLFRACARWDADNKVWRMPVEKLDRAAKLANDLVVVYLEYKEQKRLEAEEQAEQNRIYWQKREEETQRRREAEERVSFHSWGDYACPYLGYDGSQPILEGQILNHPQKGWVRITNVSKGRKHPDAESFGGSDRLQYNYKVNFVPATEEEIKAKTEKEAAKKEAVATMRSTIATIDSISADIRKNGERPESAAPAGENIPHPLDPPNIMGGGKSFYCDNEGGYIWFVERNSGDGDTWLANNAPGSIAWRVPASDEVWKKIKSSIEEYQNASAKSKR